MAFDGSGNYVLSDTIAPATNADANELQAILTDIQNALTKCVVADGQSTITGALKGADGTAALPAYAFAADLNTGIYRIGSDNIGVSCGGVKILDLSASGISGTYVDPLQILSTDAGAGIGPTLDLYRNSASPAVNDVLGSIDFNGKDSGAAKQLYARIVAKIGDPTAATEDADLFLQTVIAGALTTILQSNGAALLSGLQFQMSNAVVPLSLAGGTTGQRFGSPTAGDTRYNTSLNGLEYWNGTAWIVLGQQPTVQVFSSGSAATFTPTAGAVRWRIREIGGGAGGGAVILNAAAVAGGTTSFQVNSTGTAWTAAGGALGPAGGAAALGGAGGSGGTDGPAPGTRIIRVAGGRGGPANNNSASPGGCGGVSPFGGAGAGAFNAAGQAAAATSGSGGGGGQSTASNAGGGGGAGEYLEFWVTGMTTATYTVGAGGAGGTAGTNAGGAGATGVIIVEEFYS